MIFFWNRYELPALHAGLITPQIPRMPRLGMDRVRSDGDVDGIIPSPPRLQSFSQLMVNTQRIEPPPQIPNVSSADDRSPYTAVTAPLSSTFDITPHSDQQSIFPPTYPGPMRSYVAAASTSLQSIRSFASIQSLVSNAAGRDSPNLIFQGGYSFNDSGSVADDSEDDSYIARVMSSWGLHLAMLKTQSLLYHIQIESKYAAPPSRLHPSSWAGSFSCCPRWRDTIK